MNEYIDSISAMKTGYIYHADFIWYYDIGCCSLFFPDVMTESRICTVL